MQVKLIVIDWEQDVLFKGRSLAEGSAVGLSGVVEFSNCDRHTEEWAGFDKHMGNGPALGLEMIIWG